MVGVPVDSVAGPVTPSIYRDVPGHLGTLNRLAATHARSTLGDDPGSPGPSEQVAAVA